MHDENGPSSSSMPARGLAGGPFRRSRSRTNLYTLVGVVTALAAAGSYFFFFLRPARQRQLEQVAKFSVVEGDVKVKASPGAVWKPARAGLGVRSGDVVQTAVRAGAELTFTTGNVVRVRPDSVVLIGDISDRSEATWRVQAGQVNFELNRKTEIATPTAATTADANSEGNISVGEAGDTGVRIFRGSAQVATVQGDTIVLNENEAVQVDVRGNAGPKSILPLPPAPLAPAAQAELPFKPLPDVTAILEWKPVPGGSTYRVAVDYNVVQADLLLSAALDRAGIAESAHELKGLDPGKYYWRVAGVNAEGLEGKYSRVSSFAVTAPLPAPPAEPSRAPLALEPLEIMEGVVALRGRTAPGSTVTVDGVELKVQRDGTFSEFLRRSGREITIKVTGPGGEVTEETRPLS